jgi:hypothetical protein
MPMFFFHIRDSSDLIEDPEGTDLPNLEAARADALVSARMMLADLLRAGKAVDGRRIEITDTTGQVLAVVPLRDALRLPDV